MNSGLDWKYEKATTLIELSEMQWTVGHDPHVNASPLALHGLQRYL